MDYINQYDSDEEVLEAPVTERGLKRLALDLNPTEIDPVIHSEVSLVTKQLLS
jgi:hypothetical protein